MSWRVRRWTILSAAPMALTGGLVVATLITGEKPGAQGYRGNLAVVASPLPEFALAYRHNASRQCADYVFDPCLPSG